jgi:hypothetical protein
LIDCLVGREVDLAGFSGRGFERVFLSGQPSTFATYFRINPESGEVRQIRPIDQLDVKEFVIYVKVNILFVGLTDQDGPPSPACCHAAPRESS